jgi:hypothetical protein
MSRGDNNLCVFCSNLLQREGFTLEEIIESGELYRNGQQIAHVPACPAFDLKKAPSLYLDEDCDPAESGIAWGWRSRWAGITKYDRGYHKILEGRILRVYFGINRNGFWWRNGLMGSGWHIIWSRSRLLELVRIPRRPTGKGQESNELVSSDDF